MQMEGNECKWREMKANGGREEVRGRAKAILRGNKGKSKGDDRRSKGKQRQRTREMKENEEKFRGKRWEKQMQRQGEASRRTKEKQL